jgi:microcystin-dependent protein
MDNILIFGKDKITNIIKPLQAFSNTIITSNMPIGSITQYAGSIAPSGWLLCDGSSFDKNAYLQLFNVISTTYGGDGNPNFNIPDLRARFPVGYKNNNVKFNLLNKKEGTETVTLTKDNIPIHNHYTFSSTEVNTLGGLSESNYASFYGHTNSGNVNFNYAIGATNNVANVGLSSSYGGNNSGTVDAFDNLPPYIVINYIIFAGV